MSSYYLLLILLSLIVLHVILRYNKSARAINKIPGPRPLPILGNMHQLNCSSSELWLKMRRYTKKYYPITRFWYIKNAIMFIRHPDDIKVLLSCKKNIGKGSIYSNLALFGGNGLIVSKGETWHQRRKIMNPAFSPTMIQHHFKISYEHTRKLIKRIASQGDETIQDLVPLFTALTLDIICESVIGVDVSETEIDGGEKYRYAIDLVCDITLYRLFRPYIMDWMMNWLPLGRKQNRAIKESRIFRDKVIEERRKYHEQTESTMNQKITNKNQRKPLLDILLSAKKEGKIDNQGVGDEIDNLISAGFDTTAVSLCYTLMLLAENKEVQDLARDEVSRILDQTDGKISAAEVQKFEYLNRCIKESLRLFSVVPHIARRLSEGLQLKDYFIPANAEVAINIFDLHRDPNFWPEPEKFDPDRFLPERIQEQHPFAYLPFSGGLRNCIGKKYAMMTMNTVLAYILYNFYLEPIDKTSSLRSFGMSVVIYPQHPVCTKFIKINKT